LLRAHFEHHAGINSERKEESVRVNPEELTLKDKVVFINRVAKVVKGGKRFNFCALVVVGDGQGWVGTGKGKAAEVPAAISKAIEQAKKHLVRIPLKEETIPHEVHGLFGGEHVLLKPASVGTGIIAGGAVRAVVELAGVHNVIAKTLGRGNPFNTVRATMEGLRQLRDPQETTRLRRGDLRQAG
jgi:small subunit ribosomal protein S5